MNEPKEHHSTPAFYFEPWGVLKNCELYQYNMTGYNGRPQVSKRHFGNVSWELHLYSLSARNPRDRSAIETDFFNNKIEMPVAPIIKKIRYQNKIHLSMDETRKLCTFLNAQRIRQPEVVRYLRQKAPDRLRDLVNQEDESYKTLKGAGDPEIPSDYFEIEDRDIFANKAMDVLPMIIQKPSILESIHKLNWWIHPFKNKTEKVITSDRPLFMSGGKDDPIDWTWMIPLTPDKVFFATRQTAEEYKSFMLREGEDKWLRDINKTTMSYASKYIYSSQELDMRELEANFHIKYHMLPYATEARSFKH